MFAGPGSHYTARPRLKYWLVCLNHQLADGTVLLQSTIAAPCGSNHCNTLLHGVLLLGGNAQVSSTSAGPTICIWDSRQGTPTTVSAAAAAQPAADPQVAKLQLDKEYRGIVALGFSPDGRLLAGVATDNSHTVTVWDWRAGWRVVGEGKGCMGEPPQVRHVMLMASTARFGGSLERELAGDLRPIQ